MQALVRYVSFGCFALCTLACGSKGDDDGDDNTMTAGTGTGGSSGGSSGATFGGSGGSTAGSGTGGAAVTKTYGFDADLEGWSVLFSNSAEGVTPLDKAAITVSWSATEGENGGGALKAEIPYDAKSQWISFGVNLTNPVDLTGKTVRARVRVASGLGDFTDMMYPPGGMKIYAKSLPGYVYANGDYQNLDMLDSWITATFIIARPLFVDEMNPAGTWDPSQVAEIGLQIESGGMATAPEPAVVLIDNITY